MTPWLEQLPLWLSLAFSLFGVVVSVRLAFLAYHGVLFAFTLILTGGILIFGFSRLLVLADPELVPIAKILEAVSSGLFLAAALYMGYRLRQILEDRQFERKSHPWAMMAKMNLSDLGWDEYSADHEKVLADDSLLPARVLWRKAHIYFVRTDEAELPAELAGKLTHDADELKDLPVVGDWVAIKPQENQDVATIHALLPRKSAFLRKEAGARTQAQVVAANIDTIFLVCGLDGDFNPSRIERYLAAAWESGAAPVIVLNKTDICAQTSEAVATAESLALGAPVLSVSATENAGIDALRAYIKPKETVAFLGSSGVGKSSLVNALLGLERQQVGEVRADDSRGRHTTRHSELFLLPGGGILLDTPGMRELQLWSDGAGLSRTFDDIEGLATRCRFNDCAHDKEPGCAIKEALEDETLSIRRWESYQKLKSELVHLASRQDKQAKLVEKKRKKELSLHIKRVHKRPRP